MLGKDHAQLTIFSVIPFLIPILYLPESLKYGLGFVIISYIASLIPDSDIGKNAKSTLHYRFRFIDMIMKNIVINFIIFFVNNSALKRRIKEGYKVKEEHRGIMHSPIGVLLSSIILTLLTSIALLIFNQFNIKFAILLFFAALFGQLMHMLQDACTVSGINFGFPFTKFNLRGNMYTFDSQRYADPMDIRPTLFRYILIATSAFIFFFFRSKEYPIFDQYLLISIFVILNWILFLSLSGVRINYNEKIHRSSLWLVSQSKVRSVRKIRRKIINKPKYKKIKKYKKNQFNFQSPLDLSPKKLDKYVSDFDFQSSFDLGPKKSKRKKSRKRNSDFF